jgi:hypothetical protein
VGIYASTAYLAQVLARDFHIAKPLCFGDKSLKRVRGVNLSTLLVHEDSWPVDSQVMAEILPALSYHQAYVYRMARFDAAHGVPVHAPPTRRSA